MSRVNREHEQQLWADYSSDRSVVNRNRLVEFYQPFVASVVSRTKRVDSGLLQAEDHIANATLGLIDAIGAFDPSRGVRFTSFATHRVRGAMLDAIRDTDWVPRSERLAESRGERKPLRVLNTEPFGDDGRLGMDRFADHREQPSDHSGSISDFWQRIVRGLSSRDSMMVLFHYRDGMAMGDVAARIGVSESRVSQRLSELRTQIRGRLERGDEGGESRREWLPRESTPWRGVSRPLRAAPYNDPDVIRYRIAKLQAEHLNSPSVATEQEIAAWQETLNRIEKRASRNGGKGDSVKSKPTRSGE